MIPPPVPAGYVEYFTKRTGNIYYEDLATGQKWYTALDSESRLYFYTWVTETGEYRSEWSLPPLSSPLATQVESRSLLSIPQQHMLHCAIKLFYFYLDPR